MGAYSADGCFHPRRPAWPGANPLPGRRLRGRAAGPFRRLRRHRPQDRAGRPALLERRGPGGLFRRRGGADALETDHREKLMRLWLAALALMGACALPACAQTPKVVAEPDHPIATV